MISSVVHGFLPNFYPNKLIVIPETNFLHSNNAIPIFHPDSYMNVVLTTSTATAATDDNWRQYVPLIVILGVLLDIVLGSPLANTVLSPLRSAAATADQDSSTNLDNNNNVSSAKERVDTEAIARAAYEQAKNMQDLNEYLEKNKTDKQRMQELMRKIDRQMEE